VVKIFLFSSLKSVTVHFGFFNLFLYIWIRDLDSEYGSRPNLNADPTGSGSETLTKGTPPSGSEMCFSGFGNVKNVGSRSGLELERFYKACWTPNLPPIALEKV
jgi:hypothetical protein